jgi:hypothetical protein
MSIIGSNILAGASGQGGFTIEESLRFNASQSSYLSWTPASAGNRKTWTWSGWVKRGTLGTLVGLFSAGQNSTNNIDAIEFNSSNQIRVYSYNSAYLFHYQTTAVYRDCSAWYHLVVAVDTTHATAASRVKIYVNGTEVTSFATQVTPTQNTDCNYFNTANLHTSGATYSNSRFFDGYLTEVNFIDGQALGASSFGEFDSVTGVWKPAEYTGTYGTNGFYLPMQLDNTVEGFNTVTWKGNSSNQNITGVGFSPDLVWIKDRSVTSQHVLTDSVRGVDKQLFSSLTNAEQTSATAITSFNSDGFTTGANPSPTGATNSSPDAFVAWCWDAGDTTVSNTDGSITSSVRASTDYGFSVVTYTGTGDIGATVGHGLTEVPSLIIQKPRSAGTSDDNWHVYHSSLGATKALILNGTGDESTSAVWWNNTAPTSTVLTVGGTGAVGYTNNNGSTYLLYCFSEVAGYSKFGSYTGTGASGNTVTTGFKPAFVMVKRTDGAGDWFMFDSTRDVTVAKSKWLRANYSGEEVDNSAHAVTFTDTGFQLTGTDAGVNGSGGTYIYMAFKDTREYAYWLDDSGNNNDWQPNGGITTNSTVTDTPTPYADGGNYATLNPIVPGTGTISNANLTSNSPTTTVYSFAGTMTTSVNAHSPTHHPQASCLCTRVTYLTAQLWMGVSISIRCCILVMVEHRALLA